MPSLMNISFILFSIPNIPNLAYTSARLRAPPATSQKWLIISSRNIFSDAWRHLCSVWRDLEFRENVTRHNKLTDVVLSIQYSALSNLTTGPSILYIYHELRIYLPSIEADIIQCVSPHQLTSHTCTGWTFVPKCVIMQDESFLCPAVPCCCDVSTLHCPVSCVGRIPALVTSTSCISPHTWSPPASDTRL